MEEPLTHYESLIGLTTKLSASNTFQIHSSSALNTLTIFISLLQAKIASSQLVKLAQQLSMFFGHFLRLFGFSLFFQFLSQRGNCCLSYSPPPKQQNNNNNTQRMSCYFRGGGYHKPLQSNQTSASARSASFLSRSESSYFKSSFLSLVS